MKDICKECGRCNGTSFRSCGIWEPEWRKHWRNLKSADQIRAEEAYRKYLEELMRDA